MHTDLASLNADTGRHPKHSGLRVLHIVDPSSPGGGACTLRLLADHIDATPAWKHLVILAGHRGHRDLAHRCGLSVAGAIPPARGLVRRRLAVRALRRLLRVYEQSWGPLDFIHAWTISAGDVARAATSRRPILATIQVGPADEAEARALRRLAYSSGALIAATSQATARECVDAGAPLSRIVHVEPGVRLDRSAPLSRAALRQRWVAAENELLIGLICQPSSWSNARDAMSIVAPLMAVPHPIRLVVFPGADRRAQALQWIKSLRWPQRMILEDDLAEPWRVLGALDAVLALGGDRGRQRPQDSREMRRGATRPGDSISIDGRAPLRPAMGVLQVIHAMAAALPVIADMADDQLTDEFVDGQSGFRVHPADLSAAMQCVLRLVTDAALRRRIGLAARAATLAHWPIERFSAQVADLAARAIRAEGGGQCVEPSASDRRASRARPRTAPQTIA